MHLLRCRAPPHVKVNLPSSDESSCDCSDSSLATAKLMASLGSKSTQDVQVV